LLGSSHTHTHTAHAHAPDASHAHSDAPYANSNPDASHAHSAAAGELLQVVQQLRRKLCNWVVQ